MRTFQFSTVREMKVYQKDIKQIGYSVYNEKGKTAFICELGTANIERILLREILKTFGPYKIIKEEDFCEKYTIKGTKGVRYYDSLLLLTDLPWRTFFRLK